VPRGQLHLRCPRPRGRRASGRSDRRARSRPRRDRRDLARVPRGLGHLPARPAVTIAFVVPAGQGTSGGDVYDRRLTEELVALGRRVRTLAVPGAWPEPDAAARIGLGRALYGLPNGTTLLLDGLVRCGGPDLLPPPTE